MKKQFPVIILSLLYLLGCVALPSCALKNKMVWQPLTPKQTMYIHHVHYQGETLEKIAEWYSGNADNWKKIVAANPAINPGKLMTGNRIFIPAVLLKKKQPMPESFLITKKPAKQKAPQQTKKEKKNEAPDEFELYGPR